MELKLQLQGQDATEETLFSLEDWIRQERIPELTVQAISSPPESGHMGEPLTILSVVLASAAVVELVKSIHIWITATRPKVKVKLQIDEFKTIEIEADNLPENQLLIDKILAAVKDSGNN